jgi:hypothetical protein
MRRFQAERALMAKRWRQEWVKHGRDFGSCHCGAGAGTMRKHRPFESHPSSSCGLCCALREEAHAKRRRVRHAGRLALAQGLADARRGTA